LSPHTLLCLFRNTLDLPQVTDELFSPSLHCLIETCLDVVSYFQVAFELNTHYLRSSVFVHILVPHPCHPRCTAFYYGWMGFPEIPDLLVEGDDLLADLLRLGLDLDDQTSQAVCAQGLDLIFQFIKVIEIVWAFHG